MVLEDRPKFYSTIVTRISYVVGVTARVVTVRVEGGRHHGGVPFHLHIAAADHQHIVVLVVSPLTLMGMRSS